MRFQSVIKQGLKHFNNSRLYERFSVTEMADNRVDMTGNLNQTSKKLREAVMKLLIKVNESTMDSEKKRLLYDELHELIKQTQMITEITCKIKIWIKTLKDGD